MKKIILMILVMMLVMSFTMEKKETPRTLDVVTQELIDSYMTDDDGCLITTRISVTDEMIPLVLEYITLFEAEKRGPNNAVIFWYHYCASEGQMLGNGDIDYDVWECLQHDPSYGCGWSSSYGGSPGACPMCGGCVKMDIMIV